MTTTLDRQWIARCVPHAGAMLLLDQVVRWDDTRIVCSAAAPTPGHPLARAGAVPALAASEYAAQAAAVHGFLLEPAVGARAGMLAKLSDVALHAACIPADRGALEVNGELVSRTDRGCLYDFTVTCSEEPVASGRLLVAFGGSAQ